MDENRQKVYLVELRTRISRDLDDCDTVHVASSKEKALAWCRANLDYAERDLERPWCFAVVSEVVDDQSDLLGTEFLGWVDWDGRLCEEGAPAYYLDGMAPAPDALPSLLDDRPHPQTTLVTTPSPRPEPGGGSAVACGQRG